MSAANVAEATPQTFTLGDDGNRLIADRWAAGDAAIGDVVLLHGGGQTRHAWHDTARILAGRGWNAIAYDARGHGESAWNPAGQYGLDALRDDLLRITEHCTTPPVLVGASMGGMTSLVACGEHPDQFRGLVLVDVALNVDTPEAKRIQAFMTAHTNGFADLYEAADAVHAYNPARPRSPSPDGLKRNLLQRDDGRWYWRWDPKLLGNVGGAESMGQKLHAVAGGVSVPTLMVRGKRSEMVSDEILADFLHHIPHAEVADIAGASHMVAGDDNNSFSAAVIRFLDQVAEAG